MSGVSLLSAPVESDSEHVALPPWEGAAPAATDGAAAGGDEHELDVRIELGRTVLAAAEAARLTGGNVVALAEAADEPVRIYGDGRLIARGQVLVLDSRYFVRITERIVHAAVVLLGVVWPLVVAGTAGAESPRSGAGFAAGRLSDTGDTAVPTDRLGESSAVRAGTARPATAAVRLPVRIVSRTVAGTARTLAKKDEPLPLAPPKRPAAHEAPGTPAAPGRMLTTVLTSLSVVLGVFLLLVWMARRGRARGRGTLPFDVVETLGRAPLTGRQEMQLVRVGHKLLLLSVTPTSAETLTEITDPGEIDRLSQICQQHSSGSMSDAFREVLSEWRRDQAAPRLSRLA
jgi:flagellar motor switch/type III secretory pathway protein FliN/flagellar biogenesis protein FliO